MDVVQVVGIVVVVVCVLSLVYTEVEKRLVFAKYERLFSQGDFAECVALLDRPVVKVIYPRYNQLYMRLNAKICLDDADDCRAIIDEMLGLKTTDDQRLALLLRAFNFFVEQEDYDRAGELLEEIREKGPEKMVSDCERTYEIFAKKSSAYIKEMEAELADVTGPERTSLCYLISLQYENRGDSKRAAEYLAQVQDAFSAAAAVPDEGAEPDGDEGSASDA